MSSLASSQTEELSIAEALSLRSDLKKKSADMLMRISDNVLVNEGRDPQEDPSKLLDSFRDVLVQLRDLIVAINSTNSLSLIDTMQLSAAIAERDRLASLRSFLRRTALDSRAPKPSSRNEIQYFPALPVEDLARDIEIVSDEYRRLDAKVQQANWLTKVANWHDPKVKAAHRPSRQFAGMTLSEAISERAFVGNELDRIAKFTERVTMVQEGGTPGLDASALISEYRALLLKRRDLIIAINLTNAVTLTNDGTLLSMIAERERLRNLASSLQAILSDALPKVWNDAFRGHTEIRSVRVIDCQRLWAEIDATNAALRMLDLTIQQVNFEAVLVESTVAAMPVPVRSVLD